MAILRVKKSILYNTRSIIERTEAKDSNKAYEVSVALLERNMEIYNKYLKTY